MRSRVVVAGLMTSVLIGTLILSSGCASHFKSLPTKQELSKSVPELERQYPELKEYNPTFGRFMCTPIWDMPYADDLVAKWGEPSEKKLSWWNLGTLFVFHNMNRWYWYVEDKKIDVLIDRPIAYSYEPHVFTLKVTQKAGPASN